MGEWRYSSTILDLGIRWRRVVSFTPRHLYSRRERAPGTHWVGSWVGPRAGLDDVEKNLFPLPGIEPRSSRPQPITIPTELSRFPRLWLGTPSSLLYSGFKTKHFVAFPFSSKYVTRTSPAPQNPSLYHSGEEQQATKLIITELSQSCCYEISAICSQIIPNLRLLLMVWDKVLGPYMPKYNRLLRLCKDISIFRFLEMRPEVMMF
jgi:hypothetical protein